MKNIFKNLCVLVGILILSYLTAPYFGSFYDKFSPQYDGSLIGFSKETAVFVAGIPLAYIFFIPLTYGLFGIKKNKHWIIWPLLPAVLLMFAADRPHFYIPVFLVAIALVLAWLIRVAISKLKHPNPPMVIK